MNPRFALLVAVGSPFAIAIFAGARSARAQTEADATPSTPIVTWGTTVAPPPPPPPTPPPMTWKKREPQPPPTASTQPPRPPSAKPNESTSPLSRLEVVAQPPIADSKSPPPARPPPSAKDNADEDDVTTGAEFDYTTPRYEPAGFPLIGGDSDIGFEFGAVGTLTKFGNGTKPYEWNMDLLLAASVKQGPTSAELTQQKYLWNFDMPGLYHDTLRLEPTVTYSRTVNQGYFSLGNASAPDRPPVINGEPGRYFQYDARELLVRELTRIRVKGPWDAMIGTVYRYEDPHTYDGSQLAVDGANGVVQGLRPLSLGTLSAGVLYDTRDNEYFPHRGAYHQISVRGVGALPTDANVYYGAFGAVLGFYFPIKKGRLVFATRGVVDAEFGNVPFYDLYTGGPFLTDEMIGGSGAVRGVPEGRYLGRLKLITNFELRAMLVHFRLLKQTFHLGGDALFDMGRTWIDYTFSNSRDGTGLGVKWGAGGGIYVQWGQAAVFRIEVAYSPDAVAENPTLPVGIYVQDGVMF